MLDWPDLGLEEPFVVIAKAIDPAWEQREVIETAHRIMNALSASHYVIIPAAEVRDDLYDPREVQGFLDDFDSLAREFIIKLRAERGRLREALEQIAAGEGYCGAQAHEYKEIARRALNEQRSVSGGATRHAPCRKPDTEQSERGAAVPDLDLNKIMNAALLKSVEIISDGADEAAIRADERAACAAIVRAEGDKARIQADNTEDQRLRDMYRTFAHATAWLARDIEARCR